MSEISKIKNNSQPNTTYNVSIKTQPEEKKLDLINENRPRFEKKDPSLGEDALKKGRIKSGLLKKD